MADHFFRLLIKICQHNSICNNVALILPRLFIIAILIFKFRQKECSKCLLLAQSRHSYRIHGGGNRIIACNPYHRLTYIFSIFNIQTNVPAVLYRSKLLNCRIVGMNPRHHKFITHGQNHRTDEQSQNTKSKQAANSSQ